jgi:hypothetical protein
MEPKSFDAWYFKYLWNFKIIYIVTKPKVIFSIYTLYSWIDNKPIPNWKLQLCITAFGPASQLANHLCCLKISNFHKLPNLSIHKFLEVCHLLLVNNNKVESKPVLLKYWKWLKGSCD